MPKEGIERSKYLKLKFGSKEFAQPMVMAGFILAKEGLKFKVIIGNEISNIFIEELLPLAI